MNVANTDTLAALDAKEVAVRAGEIVGFYMEAFEDHSPVDADDFEDIETQR